MPMKNILSIQTNIFMVYYSQTQFTVSAKCLHWFLCFNIQADILITENDILI